MFFKHMLHIYIYIVFGFFIGWTALHEASCKGFSEIVLALLEVGANVNSRGADGILPIHDAIYGNHLKVIFSRLTTLQRFNEYMKILFILYPCKTAQSKQKPINTCP